MAARTFIPKVREELVKIRAKQAGPRFKRTAAPAWAERGGCRTTQGSGTGEAAV